MNEINILRIWKIKFEFITTYGEHDNDLMIGVDLVCVVLHKQIRDLVITYASRKKRNVNRGKPYLIRKLSY